MPSRHVRSFGLVFLRLVLCGALLLSVACGARDVEDDGGGGGGGGGAMAAITQATSVDMAGAVMRAVERAVFMPPRVDAAIPPDLGALQAPADELPGRDIPAIANRAAFGPNLVACNVSGDVDLQGDVIDTMTYNIGDVVMGDYMMCDFGTGFVFDGIMDFTITALSGDLLSSSYDTTLDVLFDTFDTGFVTFGGDPTVEIDTTSDPLFDYVSYGSSITIEDGGDTHTLSNFTTDLGVDESGSPVTYTFAADADMTSSVFTGAVSFSTTTVFDGELPIVPGTGELRIFGANNASIRVQPMGTTNVDLNIDLDGNGSIDVLVSTTWAALGF